MYQSIAGDLVWGTDRDNRVQSCKGLIWVSQHIHPVHITRAMCQLVRRQLRLRGNEVCITERKQLRLSRSKVWDGKSRNSNTII